MCYRIHPSLVPLPPSLSPFLDAPQAITATPHTLMSVTSAVIGSASGLSGLSNSDSAGGSPIELPCAYPLLTAWAEQALTQVTVAVRTFVLFSAAGRDPQHPDLACFPFDDLGDVLRHSLSHLYQCVTPTGLG